MINNKNQLVNEIKIQYFCGHARFVGERNHDIGNPSAVRRCVRAYILAYVESPLGEPSKACRIASQKVCRSTC